MAALERMAEWLVGRPSWWGDAAYRLLQKNKLDPNDISELLLICRSQYDALPDGVVAPVAQSLVTPEDGAPAHEQPGVILTYIREPVAVSALAQDQTLRFEPTGMTVIYGDNGSGKSSYAKILKNACRARGEIPTVRPNVFLPADGVLPAAVIGLRSKASDQEWRWELNGSELAALKSINVFDSKCAVHYVEHQAEAAFRPFGLDVLDRLGDACSAVQEGIEQEIRGLGSQPDWRIKPTTRVARFLEALSPDTQAQDVVDLATLAEEEAARLVELDQSIKQLTAEDPKKKAVELKQRANRFRVIGQELVTLAEALHSDRLAEVKDLQGRWQVAQEAARVASQQAFMGQPLEGVGSQAWQQLWMAAEAYSREYAYPDQPFPVAEGDARCVLCHQDLSAHARSRLRSFEAFVKDATQKTADGLKQELERRRQAIVGLSVQAATEAALVELESDQPEIGQVCSSFRRSALGLRDAVLSALQDSRNWESAEKLSEQWREPLENCVAKLLKDAQSLESSEAGEKLQALREAYDELEARKALGGILEDVFSEIKRLKRLRGLQNCLASANTRALSLFSNQLTEELVSQALCGAFTDELEQLGLREPKVLLEKSGSRRGVTYHRLYLADSREVAVGEIASEGEYRCIAIASFLAEISAAPDGIGVVFDDPVSSLDHRWRFRIAERLVREARNRQVVVLTHDLAFLLQLAECADESNVPHGIRHLSKRGPSAGICIEEGPWDALPVKKRIGKLKDFWQALKKTRQTSSDYDYARAARGVYADLRDCWERLVEEVLLNGTVERFGRAVHTQKLKPISEEDIEAVRMAMSKCSRLINGHDHAPDLNEPVPEPDELWEDIIALESVRKAIEKAR